MKEKDETVETAQEPYTQPLLTKHEQLRELTGKSGEKADEGGGHGKHRDKGKKHGHR